MVVNGVLIPVEMRDASKQTLARYAAKVRRGNSDFIAAYFALEDQAIKLGYPDLPALTDSPAPN